MTKRAIKAVNARERVEIEKPRDSLVEPLIEEGFSKNAAANVAMFYQPTLQCSINSHVTYRWVDFLLSYVAHSITSPTSMHLWIIWPNAREPGSESDD